MMDKQNQKEVRDSLKERVTQELANLYFTGQEDVLKRTHPKRIKDHLSRWWNKEIEIPVIPAFSLLLLLIGIGFGFNMLELDSLFLHDLQSKHREMVDTGVGIYWSDMLEKAVSRK